MPPLKSDPTREDFDGDGLNDRIEITEWFDPLNPDPDGDGRLDSREYAEGTDPYCYDKTPKERSIEFKAGFLGGDVYKEDSIDFLLGQIVGGIAPYYSIYADLRDTVINLVNEDYAAAGLSAIGFVPIAGDAVSAASKLGKFITKNLDNAPLIRRAVIVIGDKYKSVLKHLDSSDFNNLVKSFKNKLISKQGYLELDALFKNAGKNLDEIAPVIGKNTDEIIKGIKIVDSTKSIARIDNPDLYVEGLKAIAKDVASQVKNGTIKGVDGKKLGSTYVTGVLDKKTGKVYYGVTNCDAINPTDSVKVAREMQERLKVLGKSLTDKPLDNCAEYHAINNALLDGSKMSDLNVCTVKRTTGVPKTPCDNCTALYGEFVEFLTEGS